MLVHDDDSHYELTEARLLGLVRQGQIGSCSLSEYVGADAAQISRVIRSILICFPRVFFGNDRQNPDLNARLDVVGQRWIQLDVADAVSLQAFNHGDWMGVSIV